MVRKSIERTPNVKTKKKLPIDYQLPKKLDHSRLKFKEFVKSTKSSANKEMIKKSV